MFKVFYFNIRYVLLFSLIIKWLFIICILSNEWVLVILFYRLLKLIFSFELFDFLYFCFKGFHLRFVQSRVSSRQIHQGLSCSDITIFWVSLVRRWLFRSLKMWNLLSRSILIKFFDFYITEYNRIRVRPLRKASVFYFSIKTDVASFRRKRCLTYFYGIILVNILIVPHCFAEVVFINAEGVYVNHLGNACVTVISVLVIETLLHFCEVYCCLIKSAIIISYLTKIAIRLIINWSKIVILNKI